MKVLRAGFKQKLDPTITKFVSSAKDDEALIDVDIQGSTAHAEMLHACGLIDNKTKTEIIHGLEQVKIYYQETGYQLEDELEDVHMNVESKLKELIGSYADHLHTARSRNDQVALDLRLFVCQKAKLLIASITKLQKAIIECAKRNDEAILPGYTHMQRAQPLLFAHALLAFNEMLERDLSRLKEALNRSSVSPLGAGALAGTSLPIDAEFSAEKLGLKRVFNNSLDAVLDRDFVMDILYACTTISIHLSQIAETLIIWFTKEFDFISLPDNLTTASSLMPQKKNPDALELVRSKSGIAIGELVSVATILKGLPQGYNRDLQDTKPGVAKVTSVINEAVKVVTLSFENLEVNKPALDDAVSDAGLYATDLLEVLVKNGVPFRQAHTIVSEIAKSSSKTGKTMDQLSLSEFKEVSSQFDQSVFQCFDANHSVGVKVSKGSTGKTQVAKAIEAVENTIE